MRHFRLPLGRSLLIIGIFLLSTGGCDDSTVESLTNVLLSTTGLETVSVVNGTDREVSGMLVVTDPSGNRILDDSLRLSPDQDGGGIQFNLSVEGEPALATYDTTFPETGSYEVSLDLSEPVGRVQSFKKTLVITAPDEQRLLVVLNPDEDPGVEAFRLPNPEKEQ